MYETLTSIEHEEGVTGLLAFSIIAIISLSFTFIHFVMSTVFMLVCVSKGVDGPCLRFFKLLTPVVNFGLLLSLEIILLANGGAL